MSGCICGGQHQLKEWTDEEISKHIEDSMDGSCIDCWCGTPFRVKNKENNG